MDPLARGASVHASRSAYGIEWEECACLSCGSGKWSALFEAPDPMPGGSGLWFIIVKCQECGLCFTNPRPSPDSIERFYPDEYEPHDAPADGSWRTPWWKRMPLMRGAAGQRKLIPMHGAGRLLDFGCGGGSFLLRMRAQGWQVTGVDCSDAPMARLRDRYGLRALTGTLPHPELAPESFDVITMWQALEHIHQPLEVLRAACNLLVRGGKLIITVPNIDSMAFRWFGAAWNGLDLPRHLIHFSPKTLRLMLYRAGFKVGRVGMVRRSGWLRHSAHQAKRLLESRTRWSKWLQNKPMSNLASWYAYLKRRSDCMVVTGMKR